MSRCSASSSSTISTHHSPDLPTTKLALALFACLQNALVGGLVFGWASIDRTLLQAPLEDGGAALTATQTTQLFTYASSTAMLSSLFLGPLLDAGGPRACLATSHLLVFLGCSGLALSTQFWHFALAVISMAFGGPGIGIAIFHVANLFPKNQFLVVSCLVGSITISFSMFAILEAIWETYSIGFRTLFGGYSLIVATSMVGTLLSSPDDPYQVLEEDDDVEEGLVEIHPSLEQQYVEATIRTYAHHHSDHLLMTDQSLHSTLRRDVVLEDNDNDDDEDDDDDDDDAIDESLGLHHHHHHHSDKSHGFHMHLDKHHSFHQSQTALESGNETAVKLMSLKDQPFLVQVQSPTFARAVLIFITTSFLANFTIASLNTEMEDMDKFNPTQRHDLSQQFTLLLSMGLLYAVPVGWVMDRMGLEVCTILTLLLGQITSLLMMVASFSWFQTGSHVTMVLGYAIYSLFRQFLFPVFMAYITARLGFKYFGMLTGIGFFLSGLAQTLMAQLVALIHEFGPTGWMDFHILQIVALAGLMVIPIADHRDIQRRELEMEQALRRGNRSPRSVASTTTAATSTGTTRLLKERDVEYGSLVPIKN